MEANNIRPVKIKLIKYKERHPEEFKLNEELTSENINENIISYESMNDDEKLELVKEYFKLKEEQEENDI